LPKDHPFSAPDFYMITPNGRFGTSVKICTTFSSFHPETWTPSYTLTTLLVSFISFFVEDQAAAGAVHTTTAQKKEFAVASTSWNKSHSHGKTKYSDMLPVLQHLNKGLQSEASVKAALAKRYPEKASTAAAIGPAPRQPEAQPAEDQAAARQASLDLTGRANMAGKLSRKRAASVAASNIIVLDDDTPNEAKAVRTGTMAHVPAAAVLVPVSATEYVDLT
jgi:ubiquitin-conjugating enzyme E2 J2